MEQLIAQQERKEKLSSMQASRKICAALNMSGRDVIQTLSDNQKDQLDQIGWILTCYKNDDNRRKQLKAAGIPEEYYDALLKLSFSGFGNLSIKAMKRLIPYLENGLTYDKALQKAGYKINSQGAGRKKRLSIMDTDEITNPVVLRAVSQAIKVINAIVRTYGPPEVVRIELARELGKCFRDRDKIKKKQKENEKRNSEIKEQIKEYKGDATVTGQDIVKFKLYQEQNGVCLYSGENLDIRRLFEPGYVDVDHIIPYSISFDDSYNNKVLVRSSENRQKGNRLPYGYFGQDAKRWNAFETRVGTQIRSYKKRQNLLMQNIPVNNDFKRRNLVDTQYLSRVIFRLVDEHLEFAETGKYDRKTQTVNGAITGEIRKRLGIPKIRANGDLHHAVDAVIIGCTSPGMIQKITKAAQHREQYYPNARFEPADGGYIDRATGEFLTTQKYTEKYSDAFPEPWPQFRKELEAWMSSNPAEELARLKLATYDDVDWDEIKPPFVSRMPRRKTTGPAHEATILSGREEGFSISRVSLTKLKLDDNREIVNYYNPESDRLLYDALKARLQEFGGNAKKAFEEPFYKPKADGTKGPLVKKVKIRETMNNPRNIRGGIAENERNVRTDVYYVEGKGYYFVPIYVMDVTGDLPTKAMPSGKEMQEKDFLFSLFPNDLIYVERKRKFNLFKGSGDRDEENERSGDGDEKNKITDKKGFFYFKPNNIKEGKLFIVKHDSSYHQKGLGGMRLLRLEKYTVDVLGNHAPVKLPEKRLTFR